MAHSDIANNRTIIKIKLINKKRTLKEKIKKLII